HGAGRWPGGPRVVTHSSLFPGLAAASGPRAPAGSRAPSPGDVRRLEFDATRHGPGHRRLYHASRQREAPMRKKGRQEGKEKGGDPRLRTWPYSGQRAATSPRQATAANRASPFGRSVPPSLTAGPGSEAPGTQELRPASPILAGGRRPVPGGVGPVGERPRQ